MLEVAIVGGGLSGLALASRLIEAGWSAIGLFEADARLGGRILSTAAQGEDADARFDLGPTWLWPADQVQLGDFVRRHTIQLFPQFQRGNSPVLSERGGRPYRLPDSQAYSGAYRIQGGAIRLIEAQQQTVPDELIYREHRLVAVSKRPEGVQLTLLHRGREISVLAKRVVLSLPPRLLQQSVRFEPALDPRFAELLAATPTWMAGHAKAIACYSQPFWREAGLSGNTFAHYPGAILGEIFDACSGAAGSPAALGGFFALPAPLRRRFRDDLPALVIEQLGQLFGEAALHPVAVHIKDWSDEPLTATAADVDIPPSHPQYGHRWLSLDHWEERLWFSGSETDSQFGGYLEGALRAAARVAEELCGGGHLR